MSVRCAIYTRKSHDERADAQLGSIERQRELCEAYIASQADAGWTVVGDRYEDPGQSGGTLVRPALARLLAEVDAGEIDVIVVYKIDRLSRSLRDFLNLVARFDRVGATFVSVTQAFSTTTSMGRLTLNILLSFAQFERELTGERSRDWKAGARARGLWTSGPPPFGYLLRDLRLEPDAERADVVRWLFKRFVKTGEYRGLAREMNERGYRNRLGGLFDGRHIKRIVTSRTYRGELPHAGGFLPGLHRPIVSEQLWRRARDVADRIEAHYPLERAQP